MLNMLGSSRRCAPHFLTNSGKLALAHLMCAALFSAALGICKWQLLRVVSVRNVFGGACGMFWALAGMVAQFRACP